MVTQRGPADFPEIDPDEPAEPGVYLKDPDALLAYPGKWVAIVDGEVKASAEKLADVVRVEPGPEAVLMFVRRGTYAP